MLNTLFVSLGISEDEVKAYLHLLEAGPATASALARTLGKPRPSMYGYLSRLQEKGLVSESSRSAVKNFAAEPPEKVMLLFKQKIEELESHQKEYRRLLPELQNKIPSRVSRPKFQIYDGEAGLQHVLKDMLLYRNIETCAFWPIESMIEILSPEFFRYHNKERIKNNIYTKAIWPIGQTVSIKKYPYLGTGKEFKREIRQAPKEIDFSMGYWIYGNKVAFISSRKESFGFIIESAELVEMLKVQFEVLWKLSKPLVINPKDTESFLKELR